MTEGMLDALRADIAFVSTLAASAGHVYHMDVDIMRTKRKMMDCAAKSILLINHLLLENTTLHVLTQFTEFATVVKDADWTETGGLHIEAAGVELLVADD